MTGKGNGLTCLGTDRSKAGWLTVADQGGNISAHLFPAIQDMLAHFGTDVTIAADVPVGLPSVFPRSAETQAREAVGPRRSSVFMVPLRSAFAFIDYRQALAHHRQQAGKGFSKQAFNIFPAIVDVDRAMQDGLINQSIFYETHPEVCFWAANDYQPLPESKKTTAGQLHRRTILARVLGQDYFPLIRAQFPLKKQAADDDIADALIALWTARRIGAGQAGRFPAVPVYDEQGLDMAIWY